MLKLKTGQQGTCPQTASNCYPENQADQEFAIVGSRKTIKQQNSLVCLHVSFALAL